MGSLAPTDSARFFIRLLSISNILVIIANFAKRYGTFSSQLVFHLTRTLSSETPCILALEPARTIMLNFDNERAKRNNTWRIKEKRGKIGDRRRGVRWNKIMRKLHDRWSHAHIICTRIILAHSVRELCDMLQRHYCYYVPSSPSPLALHEQYITYRRF